MTFKLAEAVDFNDGQISKGKLSWEDIAHLVHAFQRDHGLEQDGKAGDRETLPALDRYAAELAEELAAAAAPERPFAGWVHSLPSLHGRPFLISQSFGRRLNPKTGLFEGHGGADFALLATPAEIEKRKRGELPEESFNGNEKSDDPAVRYRWYCPSEEQEHPYVASADGEVIVAGVGTAKNGQKVIEVVVDYGTVGKAGPIAIEGLHFKRLLRGRGRCRKGEPLAIVGSTATNKNHLHGEVWSDAAWDKDGKPERGEKVDPGPVYAQMVRYDYRPPPGVVTFDPQYLIAA